MFRRKNVSQEGLIYADPLTDEQPAAAKRRWVGALVVALAALGLVLAVLAALYICVRGA